MWPLRIPLGPYSLQEVEIAILLGAAISAYCIRRRLATEQVSGRALAQLLVAALVGGALGAKLFYALPALILGVSEIGAPAWSNGTCFYGGALGGSAGVALFALAKRISAPRVLDAVSFGIPIGFAFGKIGCLLSGCCYGHRSDGSLTVAFPPGSAVFRCQVTQGLLPASSPASLPVHPVQLWEAGSSLLLLALLSWVSKLERAPGCVYLTWLLGYSCLRFLAEFARGDAGRHSLHATRVSDSQIVALILIPLCSAALFIRLRRGGIRGMSHAGSLR